MLLLLSAFSNTPLYAVHIDLTGGPPPASFLCLKDIMHIFFSSLHVALFVLILDLN